MLRSLCDGQTRSWAIAFSCAASDRRGLIEKLGGPGKTVMATASARRWLFVPGQGAQHVGMGLGLYRRPSGGRADDRAGAAIIEPLLGLDLRKVLYGDPEEAGPHLQATALAQPALFSVSYAVAALWRSLGVEPVAMIGHSIGEFVAAVLAGVMRLEDALQVVVTVAALCSHCRKARCSPSG